MPGTPRAPFDIDLAVSHLRRQDKAMRRLIDLAGECTLRPERSTNVFGTLLAAIINQQLSNKAAATILARVLAATGDGRRARPESLLATPDERLRQAGMSRSKVAFVKDLAEKTLDGTVPTLARLRAMDDAEIIDCLTQVRGIGVWTVEMLLIFHLGRPDVLPVDDLGVRKGFMLSIRGPELPTKKELIAHGESWRPYRSVASWYLWRSLELERGGRP
jgi:3-methyladenine DNA glycosylase/8-oxoguanine DNA glycosylase